MQIHYDTTLKGKRYPWKKLGIDDYFEPSRNITKQTMHTIAKHMNYRSAPKRFAPKTTKGRWGIWRIA